MTDSAGSHDALEACRTDTGAGKDTLRICDTTPMAGDGDRSALEACIDQLSVAE